MIFFFETIEIVSGQDRLVPDMLWQGLTQCLSIEYSVYVLWRTFLRWTKQQKSEVKKLLVVPVSKIIPFWLAGLY